MAKCLKILKKIQKADINYRNETDRLASEFEDELANVEDKEPVLRDLRGTLDMTDKSSQCNLRLEHILEEYSSEIDCDVSSAYESSSEEDSCDEEWVPTTPPHTRGNSLPKAPRKEKLSYVRSNLRGARRRLVFDSEEETKSSEEARQDKLKQKKAHSSKRLREEEAAEQPSKRVRREAVQPRNVFDDIEDEQTRDSFGYTRHEEKQENTADDLEENNQQEDESENEPDALESDDYSNVEDYESEEEVFQPAHDVNNKDHHSGQEGELSSQLIEDTPGPSSRLIEDTPGPSSRLIGDAPSPSSQLIEDTPGSSSRLIGDAPTPSSQLIEDTPGPSSQLIQGSPESSCRRQDDQQKSEKWQLWSPSQWEIIGKSPPPDYDPNQRFGRSVIRFAAPAENKNDQVIDLTGSPDREINVDGHMKDGSEVIDLTDTFDDEDSVDDDMINGLVAEAEERERQQLQSELENPSRGEHCLSPYLLGETLDDCFRFGILTKDAIEFIEETIYEQEDYPDPSPTISPIKTYTQL
ncbi:Oidioi.mRNA.OKI2018_I69.chr1.g90.t1.cds [Oikopleura dioica]|uniref:Oidioi.mRNA.OKI2018_I69.chr1.g90.t1.cds n=1 Tax=Oikopleura dioica TaxID=34765 RepID=A0ABN7SJ94_OIKDI|nr:Oidioi.mRNA.OKI2018_I69.chr1.g90.t1.cds [Oikopleura dioica]